MTKDVRNVALSLKTQDNDLPYPTPKDVLNFSPGLDVAASIAEDVILTSLRSVPIDRRAFRGEFITHLRMALGVTQVQFATQMGWTFRQVQSWEQGLRKPRQAQVTFLRLFARELANRLESQR